MALMRRTRAVAGILTFCVVDPTSCGIAVSGRALSSCADNETFCESLNFCLPGDDCSTCFDYPQFNKELRRCTPAPVQFATDFCGGGALSVACQNYATQMHNCMSTCGSLHPTGAGGEFINCVTASDSSCPLTICEQACGCIGEPACSEPCMGHCTKFRDDVLRKPERFKTRGAVAAYVNRCVFGKKPKRHSFLEKMATGRTTGRRHANEADMEGPCGDGA
ncbi:unnamed protein product [Amoebophrya sp. A120]|nr:unnamed protein product [Amoebophrya sp. A120]|eukprot:GSA120T00017438001.1